MVYSSKARWEQQTRAHLGEDYQMLASNNMGAIHVMVFAHTSIWKYCWDIRTGQVATGFGNVVGNKGGTQVGFCVGHTSILTVNAHLPAHTGKMRERTQSFTRILTESPIRRSRRGTVGVHDEYDRVFFMGDLNARVEAPRSDVDDWLTERKLDKCLEKDQLLPLLRAGADAATVDGPVGLWPSFEEADIMFPPTYKFDSQSDRYDTSKKQRVPSWTDRILWKRDPEIRSIAYGSVESMLYSDHRPVFGQFEVIVDLSNWTGPQSQVRKDKSAVCAVQ